LTQSFETINSIPYAGKTISFSFYARAGANYSATSSALGARVWSGTGTDQNLGVGYTGGAIALNNTATLTTTWQRFTYTGTIPTTATEIGIQFFGSPTGTAGANDWYEITGVQIDLGSVALPFRTCAATLAGELAACQRYYTRWTAPDAYTLWGVGVNTSSTGGNSILAFPTTMRTKPSSVDYSTVGVAGGGGAVLALTALTLAYASDKNAVFGITVASGLTAQNPHQLFSNNSTSAYIGVSAEL
jgi:hypothetical protein